MQLSQIITDVRNELVEASASFWSDAELIALANRAERDFVQKTRCLEGKDNLTTVAGQQDYPLPANFLSEAMVFINVPTPDGTPNWLRLDPTDLEKQGQVNTNFLSSDISVRGVPSRCWIWNKSLNFDPIPDQPYAIAMFFKAKPIAMASSADSINIDDSLSEAINHFVLWKAWKKEKEPAEAEDNKNMYAEDVKQGFRYMKKLSNDLRNRIDIPSNQNFNSGSLPFFNPLQ